MCLILYINDYGDCYDALFFLVLLSTTLIMFIGVIVTITIIIRFVV